MQLFHESFSDALREVIAAAGGPKVVGAKLWPSKMPDDARRRLLDCLNEDREARLSPEDLAQVLRMGRDAGCHAAVNWLLRACGYEDARPVEPADEQAELQRQYVAAARSMAAMAARIEALATAPTLRRAA